MGISTRASLASETVVLTGDQIQELNQKLSKTRHDINNHLAVMVAAIELIRYKPESAAKWLTSVESHPMLISGALKTFSEEFEKMLGITAGAYAPESAPSAKAPDVRVPLRSGVGAPPPA